MDAVIERALEHDLFARLDIDLRQALAWAFEVVQLEPGELLFEQRGAGDAMFLVDRGELDVRLERSGDTVTMASLGPGDVVGEIAVLTGQTRGATVIAGSPSTVVRLDSAHLSEITERHPELLEQLALSVAARIRRQNLASVLPKVSGSVSSEQMSHLIDAVEWAHLASGEVLFAQGQRGDGLALVVNGAFDVTVAEDGVVHRIGRISRGEFVGEMSLLADAPRSATVTAIRDSDVALMSTEVFLRLSRQFPDLALAVIRNTAGRLSDANRTVRPLRHEAHTTAFVPVDLDAARWLVEGVVDELAGSSTWLDRDRFESRFGRPGIAETSVDDPANLAVVGWLSRFEHEHDYVAYVADPSDTTWTQRCLRQADRVYVVVRAGSNPEPSDLERRILRHVPPERVQLVLVHESGVNRPSGTQRWLEHRQLERHHHVRRGDQASVQRIARRVAGETVGVVFSGGGARGFAHGGVARAIAESNTPVDLMCGTSMGALVSAKVLLDGWEAFAEAATEFGRRRHIVDYTLPISSIASSRRVSKLLERLYGDVLIEDMWLPWFAVSTNLSQARPDVASTGLIRDAVRASISIPGVFSPVARNGDLIVDGGVMNNMPVDLARTIGGAGHVIAVNASPRRERSRRHEFADHASGWRLFGARFIPGLSAERVPPLGMTVMRALDVNSVQRTRELRPAADLMIAPDTSGFGVLDWEAHPQLLEIGYQAGLQALADRKSLRRGVSRT